MGGSRRKRMSRLRATPEGTAAFPSRVQLSRTAKTIGGARVAPTMPRGAGSAIVGAARRHISVALAMASLPL